MFSLHDIDMMARGGSLALIALLGWLLMRDHRAALPARIAKLYFAGDWCFPELPATLEAAVISGENAARLVLEDCRNG